MSSKAPPPPFDIDSVTVGWQGGVVCGIVGVGLIVMGFDLCGPDLVFALMTSLMMAAQIISTKTGAAGFSNTGVLTVVALFIVAEGVTQTGALDVFLNFMMGRTRSPFWAQVRMIIPTVVSSAFLNNTPVVALMIPILTSFSHRNSVSLKKLLIPMSYFTVFGGTCTLIGTSTNLVISGMQNTMFAGTPYGNFGFFTITPYGIPYAIWGIIYILIFSRWLLPDDSSKGRQDLTQGLLVQEASTIIGRDPRSCRLCGKTAILQIVAVSRDGQSLTSDLEELTFLPNDVIYVSGTLVNAEMFAQEHQLTLVTDESEDTPSGSLHEGAGKSGGLFQVTIKKGSPLVGLSIREIGFRGRFNAAVLAVRRSKVNQPGSLGQVVLEEGDVLILSVPMDFDADNEDITANFEKITQLNDLNSKEFSIPMKVAKGAKIAGKTIQQAGLRGIRGLYLFEIRHESGEDIKAVGSTRKIQEGDTLWFAGDLEGVTYLRKMQGLTPATNEQIRKLPFEAINRHLVQVVVSPHGPLVGRTVVETKFRKTYDAAVLAVHREGERLTGDVRDTKLQAGDLLLCETGSSCTEAFVHNKAFTLVTEVPNSSPLKRNRAIIALVLTVIMIVTQIIGGAMGNEFIHLWPCAMLVSACMLLTKCLSTTQARKSIDWSIYVCIAFAFAVGSAIEETGVAAAIASVFVSLSVLIGGQTAALAIIYLVTNLLSEVLTNNAAGAIMFPIAQNVAVDLGINPDIMSVSVMLGASAGWMLPYAYQCNLMVFAAGNYRSVDFVRIGGPLNIWLLVGTTVILHFSDQWWICVVASVGLLAIVLGIMAVWDFALSEKQRAAIGQGMPRWGKRSTVLGDEGLEKGDGTKNTQDQETSLVVSTKP